MYPTGAYDVACHDSAVSEGFFCQTDNSTLTVFRESSLNTYGKASIAATLNGSYAGTDLTVSFSSSAVTSGSAETDIIYQGNKPVPSGNIGMTWCNDAVSARRCDQHYARWSTAGPTQSTACHETGHAVGLTHGNRASPALSNGDDRLRCMTRPSEFSTLGPTNVGNINATY